MKIALMQDQLRLGGTEVQALALGNQWKQAGHAVRLVVFRPGGELAASEAARNLQPVVLQKNDWGPDWWAPHLRETMAEIAPEVVVAFGREANAKLRQLMSSTPRPLLVGTLRSGREQPVRFWRALQLADAVVANARWTGAAATAHGAAREKISVIYSGVARMPAPGDGAAARADWRQRAGTPPGAVVFLCVAGFRKGKGQDELLRAVAALPGDLNWQLWFAGAGPYWEPCKRLADDLGLGAKVQFLDQVNEPASLYAAADAGVLASLAEALPNFLIEAQAAGLPVVSTAVGGAPECFEDGETGLAVPPGDTSALSAALERVVREAGWREAARSPAQARARELFDAKRNAARWVELFEGLLQTRNG